MKTIILLSILLLRFDALADEIRLGVPAFGGSGCPDNTVSLSLSEDQKQILILFDQFRVEAGKTTGRVFDRKNCSIAFPLHVPAGYSVALSQADYSGFNNLAEGAKASLSVDYFFAGQKGARFLKEFTGPQNTKFQVTTPISSEALVWSPCGVDVNLRVNSVLLVQTKSMEEMSFSELVHMESKLGFIYGLQLRRCG